VRVLERRGQIAPVPHDGVAAVVSPPGDRIVVPGGAEHVHVTVVIDVASVDRGRTRETVGDRAAMPSDGSAAVVSPPYDQTVIPPRPQHIRVPVTVDVGDEDRRWGFCPILDDLLDGALQGVRPENELAR